MSKTFIDQHEQLTIERDADYRKSGVCAVEITMTTSSHDPMKGDYYFNGNAAGTWLKVFGGWACFPWGPTGGNGTFGCTGWTEEEFVIGIAKAYRFISKDAVAAK